MAIGKHIIPAVPERMILTGNYGGRNGGRSATEYAMMGYLDTILQAYVITEDMLVLAVMFLDAGRRKSLVEFLFPDRKHSPVMKELYDEAEGSLGSPELLAETILSGIKEKTIPLNRKAIVARLRELVRGRREELPSRDVTAFEERLAGIAGLFNLTEPDVEVLRILYCIYGERNMEFAALVNNMSFQDFITFVAVTTGLGVADVNCSIGRCVMLYQIRINSELSALGCGHFVEMEDGVIEYLAGVCDRDLIRQYLVPDSDGAYALSSFTTVPAESARLAVAMLSSEKPVNILLYGVAGAGKTEFARSIAAGAGKRAFFLQYGNGRESQSVDPSRRMIALFAAVHGVSPDRGVIIVDEADSILNTMNMMLSNEDTVEKGRLNAFLDAPKAHVIWIANTVVMAEDSTLRRFPCSLYFGDFTPVQRKIMWRTILERHPLRQYFSPSSIGALAGEFNVSAGGIAGALDGVASAFGAEVPSKREVVKAVRELLSRHEALVSGSYGIERRRPDASAREPYDVRAVNTDIDIAPVISQVKAFARRMKHGAARGARNMNVLLWGTPGTGKTAFAGYLAGEAGLRCIVKRSSDLESMYVGQTEKNIAEAFREAEDAGAVLFIDEADSFFTARVHAGRSWEVSRTNEFLTQMENHRGILVCCTNLLPSIDRAAMRRFVWKVEFRPLLPEAKAALVETYFLAKGRHLSETDARRVRGIAGLTPGDIKNVRQRHCAFPRGGTNMSAIIDELEREVSYRDADRTGKIGFS